MITNLKGDRNGAGLSKTLMSMMFNAAIVSKTKEKELCIFNNLEKFSIKNFVYEKHSSKTEESVGVKETRSEEEKKREQIWASDVRYSFVLRDLYTGYRLRKIITGVSAGDVRVSG